MNLRTDRKYKPFSTGSQYADWTARNCGSCKKGYDERHSKFRCKLEWALAEAYCLDGMVEEEVAKAIGYLDNLECYIWECPGWARR